MTTPFEQRLAQVLQIPTRKMPGALAEGIPHKSRLAKDMGLGEMEEGKTTDDLALTRFPAGMPADVAAEFKERLGLPDEYTDDDDGQTYDLSASGLTGKCIRLDESERNVKFTDLDASMIHPSMIQPAWSAKDILTALWPMMARAAREYSGGMWNKTPGSFDRDAFEEFIQNCVIEVMRLIENEEDRGDAYLPYVKRKFGHAVSGGVGATSEGEAATSLLQAMYEAGTPQQLNTLVNHPKYGIPPEVQANPDLKPRQGNRFGKYVKMILPLVDQLMPVLKRHASKDQATKMGAAEELDEVRQKILKVKDQIHGLGVGVFGAKSGQYDTVSVSHNDSPAVRWLKKVAAANSLDELQGVGPPPGSPSKNPDKPNLHDGAVALFKKYEAALNGDIVDGKTLDPNVVKDEMAAWLLKNGDRDAWRAQHRREGTMQATPSGEEEPHPEVTSKDTLDRIDELVTTKEAARQFLLAGIKLDPKTGEPVGVEVIDKQNRPMRLSFINVDALRKGDMAGAYRDYRIIIRHFGISDYPLKNTGRDPEVNWKLFDELVEKFTAIAGSKNADDAIMVKPMNKTEAIWLADMTAKLTSEDYDEFMQNKAELLDFQSDTKEMPILIPDEDTAVEIARQLASSKWARKGYPAMRAPELDEELWPDAKSGNAGAKMKELFTRPPAPEGKDAMTQGDQGFAAPGSVTPDSKMGRMAKAMRDKLGINFDERPWAIPKDEIEGKPAAKPGTKPGEKATTPPGGKGVEPPKEAPDEKVDDKTKAECVTRALWKAHCMVEYFMKTAILTEGLDDYDMGLLYGVRRSLARGITRSVLPQAYDRN